MDSRKTISVSINLGYVLLFAALVGRVVGWW